MVPFGRREGRASAPPAVRFPSASSGESPACRLAHAVRGLSFVCCARSRFSYVSPADGLADVRVK